VTLSLHLRFGEAVFLVERDGKPENQERERTGDGSPL
jgi:hypothetical protein